VSGFARGWFGGSGLGLLDFFPGGGVVGVAVVDPAHAAVAQCICAALDRLGAVPGVGVSALAALAGHNVFFFTKSRIPVTLITSKYLNPNTLTQMYYLQLYSASYTSYCGMVEVNSNIVPRVGDTVEDKNQDTYIVFDVTHFLSENRCMVIVRARHASQQDRVYVLKENGFLPSDEMHAGPDELFVSQKAWVNAFNNLPNYKDVED